MSKSEGYNRPLSDYTIPVNELLDSGITEVENFGRDYMRRIFGMAAPSRDSTVLAIPNILCSRQNTPQPPSKRERPPSPSPDSSSEDEDEERRLHASFLLHLSSPEAATRDQETPTTTTSTTTTSEPISPPLRKKHKARYANSMVQPFSQMVRPAYEFMPEHVPLGNFPQRGYTPPQSPQEQLPRLRAQPGRCARRAQGCNENTKFRPVISDWTCYKNYEPCPKDSQVGWCNKCWCNKGHYSDEDFLRRKFDLLEDQVAVWAEEFHVAKFEVWLQDEDRFQGTVTTKKILDPNSAKKCVLRWRQEWERTGTIPGIKIRPL